MQYAFGKTHHDWVAETRGFTQELEKSHPGILWPPYLRIVEGIWGRSIAADMSASEPARLIPTQSRDRSSTCKVPHQSAPQHVEARVSQHAVSPTFTLTGPTTLVDWSRAAMPLSRTTVAGISIVLALCSCRGDMGGERTTPGTQHPTEDNIPVIEDPRFVLHEQDSAQRVVEFTGLPSHTIGINEGKQHAMIGSIIDMVVRRNALYYADREYSEIRVYDHSGVLLEVVGSPGRGPGEFSNLTRVAVREDEVKLFAWDDESRVQVFGKLGFRLRAGELLSHHPQRVRGRHLRHE